MNSTEENTMLNLGLKLGENLKKFRLQRELTQEQLADVLGVSAQAVSRWENGTTYPDITLLPTIASYFEITLDELMSFNSGLSINWHSVNTKTVGDCPKKKKSASIVRLPK